MQIEQIYTGCLAGCLLYNFKMVKRIIDPLREVQPIWTD
jgi:hypothetical protein